MIYQTNRLLPYEINRFGCRFRCLLAIAELDTGKNLTVEQILSIYAYGKDTKAIAEECRTTGSEHLLINDAFVKLGEEHKRGFQVGAMGADGAAKFWAGNAVEYHYVIAHWITGGRDGHWTLFDTEGKELFDPYNPSEAKYQLNKAVVDRRLLYRVYLRG